MTPPMWQSRKGKTVKRVKSGDQGLGWEKGCIDRAQRILRAVKILWYYNDGYMSLYACLFTKSCLTFCNPRDCGPTGSSVHGIFQARILEWVVILLSKPTDCTTPGVNLMESVDFGWWWCVSCNTCTIQWGMLIMGRLWMCGAGSLWELSVSYLQVCCEPKTSLKKVLTKFFHLKKVYLLGCILCPGNKTENKLGNEHILLKLVI